MKVSVCVASIIERQAYYLKRMLSILEPQLTSDIELVIETDNREMTIGAKQQKLLERAQGDYICYVDEDDIIPGYYIAEILKAIETQPDCVGINGIITLDEKNPYPFFHSIQYDHWYTDNKGHYRTPNHINPVKREIALLSGFKNITAADHGYAIGLQPLLKTEVIIEKCMYFYLTKTKS